MAEPLFRGFLTKRQESGVAPAYVYDHSRSVNVVRTPEGVVPAIELACRHMSLSTLTEVAGEGTDIAVDYSLSTKTFSYTESDD